MERLDRLGFWAANRLKKYATKETIELMIIDDDGEGSVEEAQNNVMMEMPPTRRESGRKGGKKGRRWGKKRPAEGIEDADSPFTSYGKMKWRSKLELNDDDLFIYFDNRLAGETECKNADCDCLIQD